MLTTRKLRYKGSQKKEENSQVPEIYHLNSREERRDVRTEIEDGVFDENEGRLRPSVKRKNETGEKLKTMSTGER